MKIPMMLIMATVACSYSTGIVLYHLQTGNTLPDAWLWPICPGIWVGAEVWGEIGERMYLCYAAGIGTMTVLGAALGWFYDCLSGGRRTGSA
jgi:hypothetical protein